MINASLVKELREKLREHDWHISIMVCKKALIATEGDIERAIDKLYRWGYVSVSYASMKDSGLPNPEINVSVEEIKNYILPK